MKLTPDQKKALIQFLAGASTTRQIHGIKNSDATVSALYRRDLIRGIEHFADGTNLLL